jgi:hypothetical protein
MEVLSAKVEGRGPNKAEVAGAIAGAAIEQRKSEWKRNPLR